MTGGTTAPLTSSQASTTPGSQTMTTRAARAYAIRDERGGLWPAIGQSVQGQEKSGPSSQEKSGASSEENSNSVAAAGAAAAEARSHTTQMARANTQTHTSIAHTTSTHTHTSPKSDARVVGHSGMLKHSGMLNDLEGMAVDGLQGARAFWSQTPAFWSKPLHSKASPARPTSSSCATSSSHLPLPSLASALSPRHAPLKDGGGGGGLEKEDWSAIGFVDIAEAGSNRAVLPPSPRPATTRGSEGSETAPDTGDGGRGDAKGGGSVHEYHDADTPPHTNPRNTPFRRQSLDRQTLSECAPHTFSLPLSARERDNYRKNPLSAGDTRASFLTAA
eukprot:CAMPEP_0179466794 /NCGR_PEP_ID=MMETSP0799-20121207/48059_1 /TAXON_ID=46947 /ORGANISM="Geminigera cryophila, Strain CCMP2564" /LENGTH=332 /DNA_ID=CAMNT_0021271831 /DNA_START=56 /DNA_END=1050 /DNA_ORIENTATION=-